MNAHKTVLFDSFYAQYHIGIQLVSFVVIASYMSISKWNNDFLPPALHRPVSSTWYVSL